MFFLLIYIADIKNYATATQSKVEREIYFHYLRYKSQGKICNGSAVGCAPGSALRRVAVVPHDLLHNFFMRRLQRRKIGMVLYTCDINRRVKS